MNYNFEKQFFINKETELFITDNKIYIDGTIYEIINTGEINGETGLIIKFDGETATIPIYVKREDWNNEITQTEIPVDKLNAPVVKVGKIEEEIQEQTDG
jgi:hypothetical protein